jgi:hypothetical protein
MVACKLSSAEYAEFIASIFRQVNRPVETYPGQMVWRTRRDCVQIAELCHLVKGRWFP